MSFASALTLVLITLKLLEFITCSWWWVLSPMWIGVFVDIVIIGIISQAIKKKGK